MDNNIQLNSYWRNELGKEFRDKAMDFVGGYAETMGELNINDDEKKYEATLDICKLMSTIFPLGVSCNMTTRETCFVAKVIVTGRMGMGKFNKYDKRIKETITIYDLHNEKLDTSKICIDSLLYLLDFFDTLNNKKS